ncbi:MAG: TonB-dependent receptor domain-containing protein, partial [Caulobacteraceae bacterium]
PDSVEGGLSGDIEGGSLGYARGAAIGEMDEGQSRLFLDASGERSDGWVPVIQGRGAVDRPLTLSDFSAGERLEYDLGDDEVLTERIAAYQEDRGAGTLFARSEAQGAQASLALVRQPATGSLGWRIQGWVTGSNLVNTSAAVSLNRNAATLADDEFATPAIGVGFNAAVRGAQGGAFWELGVDARNYDGVARDLLYNQGVPTGEREGGGGQWIAGAYAEGSRRFGPFLAAAGVRLDGWENYDSSLVQTGTGPLDEHPANRGGLVPSGRVGLRYDLSPSLYLRTAAYSGFRPATLNELHRSFRVRNDVTESNADLSPERLYGAEAGLGGEGRIVWDADVFYNRLVDAVTNVTVGHGPGLFPLAGFVPAGGTLFERENAGSIEAYGVEGDGDVGLSPSLDLRAAFAYTHARVQGGSQAPQLTGLRPAETPTTVVTADLVWRAVSRPTLTGRLRYQSDAFDDDEDTRRIEGGTEVDARAEWRVRRDLSAFVAADNLLDVRLQTGRSAVGVVTYGPPLILRAGLDFRR